MSESLQLLRSIISSIRPIPDADWTEFSLIWKPFKARRKETLTSENDTEKYLYFVTEGVQRVFYLDDQGREATLVFTYAPSFGGVIDSFLLEKPSRYYYETLTPSSFLRASFSELKELMDRKPSIERLIRTGLTESMSGVMERLVEIQCFSSEEKFRKLLSRSPHIMQLVPHKYLANYLGIDPTNFSKLVNKVRI
ncbi:Crp/Fnr family transcriptional regulator [Dyadobacter bucti]|uniref:Crp/Fnr family transcriptional regulator n=1 Tax=Dyadobacter bucti TaxID=2572203 RepID=UPI001108BD26|nr:Crp/Fnr family transcriptional regulator [Dyadobacter bucti]